MKLNGITLEDKPFAMILEHTEGVLDSFRLGAAIVAVEQMSEVENWIETGESDKPAQIVRKFIRVHGNEKLVEKLKTIHIAHPNAEWSFDKIEVDPYL